jgi:hypothetical protein
VGPYAPPFVRQGGEEGGLEVHVRARDLLTGRAASLVMRRADIVRVMGTGWEELGFGPSDVMQAVASRLTLFYSREQGVMVLSYIGKLVVVKPPRPFGA